MSAMFTLRQRWYKSPIFWFATLFVLYSIFGWLILPSIIRSQVTQHLKTIANWDTEIEQVQFNPYALSLEVQNLATFDAQAKKQIGFERLYVNFEALRSLGGTLSFSTIELSAPFVNVTLEPEGVTNFQRAFAVSEPAPEAPEAADATPLALYFERIALDRGQVEVNDYSAANDFHLTLQPLSLNLAEFATHHNEGGDYSLDISLGDSQMLRWKGQIGIAPLKSKGQLALENIQITTFAHYFKDLSPYWLNSASVSVAGNYVLDNSGMTTDLKVEQGRAVVSDLSLSTTQDAPEFLSLRHLTVAPIQFDLVQKTASVGSIELDTLKTLIIRDADGQLPVLTALSKLQSSAAENAEKAEPEVSSARPFTWTVGAITLLQSELDWQDQALAAPASISLNQINLTLSELSQDLSQAWPYQGSWRINEAPFALSGKISPLPLKVEGAFQFDALPLNLVQNYLSETTHVLINSGNASMTTQYTLNQQDDALHGHIQAEIALNALALSDATRARPLAGFESLSLQPIDIELEPRNIAIGSITLTQPYGEAFVAEDGTINLATLMKVQDAVNETGPIENPAPQPEPSASTPPTFKLGKFDLTDGRFSFSDSSVTPPFSTRLTQLNGQLEDLSSDPAQRSKAEFKGKLDDQGHLDIRGTVNPLGPRTYTQLKIALNNVDLTPTSPYTARFLGYPVQKGKLALDIDYKNEGTRLKAMSTVGLNQFTLGDSVDSPDALKLPLPLALALLRDLKGNIDIELPVEGDINDPSFSIGSIVLTAFTNLLTKTVASPFTLLGSLIGGGSDMSIVEFAAGQATIDDSQRERLDALATALKKRPALKLEVKGIADPDTDRAALQKLRRDQALAALDSDVQNAREKLLQQWLSAEQVQTLKTISDANQYALQVDAALLDTIEIKPIEFNELARQRAQNLARYLGDEGGIELERLFILEPSVLASGHSDLITVASEFGLGTR